MYFLDMQIVQSHSYLLKKKKIPHSVDGNMAKYSTRFTVLLSEDDDSRIAEFL